VPLGETDRGTLHLDLNRLLAGRCLIQGSSGAGKSAALRHLIEEAHDYLTVMIVDPEGEFGNLAEHIGAASIRASEIATDGLTAAALRARHHRLALHLDLTALEPDIRIQKAAAFFAGLLASAREDWAHTVMVAIDKAHLLAPRRLGYGRSWGRSWLAEEDDLIRHAYAHGDNLAPLRQRLGRSRASIVFHVGELGLHGTHARPRGWRTDPTWTDKQIAVLRRDYGRVPTPELAARLGRKKGGIFMRRGR